MNIELYLVKLIDIAMIFAPNIGFMAQISKFREVKSSEGFSKLVSFIILMANIFRIYFWIGKQFNIVLLFQSIVSIIMQIILLRECLNLAPERTKKHNVTADEIFHLDRPVNIWDMSNFWNWPYLIDYIYFLTILTLVLGFMSNIIGFNNTVYIEIIGVLSASVEACIGLPQVYANFKAKSVETLSVFMIFTWVVGDSIKTFYFLKTLAPLQLIASGLFQLTIDIVILSQIVYYTKKKADNKGLALGYPNKKGSEENYSLKDHEIINI